MGKALDQTSWYRYLVLFALTLSFMSNFLDRQILAILTEPVKNDLGLSDTQIGILSGPVFAVFYATFAIPLAWLSDRANRVRIIAACCTLWSLFTLALIAHRTGVAVVGLDVPEYPPYVPHPAEVLITVGIVSLGLLAFRTTVALLPVYESHERPASGPPDPDHDFTPRPHPERVLATANRA